MAIAPRRRRLSLRAPILALAALWAAATVSADETSAGAALRLEQGRRIYEEGVLPSGAALEGVRLGDQTISGAAAACVSCHRRSGMGTVEGDLQIPPIGGRFLYAKRADMALAIMDPRFGRQMNRAHEPYTDATLDGAIRLGTNAAGRPMNAAMPRYTLDDAALAALTAYLRQLSGLWSPGVSADAIRFATVVAPDVSPDKKRILVDMLRNSVAQKNGSTITGAQRGGRRHMSTGPEQILGTERKWDVDVWQLEGPPDTWNAQLGEFYRRKPVFALLSGLSNGTWAPVHEFCERERVPCWFPSVDLPPFGSSGIYSLYFSRGVALEADVLARHLLSDTTKQPRRLVQIYRDGTVGHGAAEALRRSLSDAGIAVEARAAVREGVDGLRDALAGVNADDHVVFWLQPADLANLERLEPVAASTYFSAELGNGEHGPLPVAWRKSARMVYPYELPAVREHNLAYFRAWLKTRKIPLTDEILQSEIYFAVAFMTDTVAEMLDNLHRDYLVERAEDMMGRREGGRAESESRDRASLGTMEQLARRYPHARRLEDTDLTLQPGQGPGQLAMRHGTTVYPRLSLGPGQRFASKGGYIVRFEGDHGEAPVAESPWIVP